MMPVTMPFSHWGSVCEPPVNDYAPSFNTTLPPRVGVQMSIAGRYGSEGGWTGMEPITLTYQWRRDGVDIPGATGENYTPTTDDIGAVIDIVETAHTACGSSASIASDNSLGAVTSKDRYWVGGTGTWNDTAGSKWAYTSGGAGGASIPTFVDNVYFDAASNGAGITVGTSGQPSSADLDFTGFTGTFNTLAVYVYGSLTLVAGMTLGISSPGVSRFNLISDYLGVSAAAAPHTLTTAGKTMPGTTFSTGSDTYPLSSWDMADNLVCETLGTVVFGYGTVNTNNHDITAIQAFFGAASVSSYGDSHLYLGSSTLNLKTWLSYPLSDGNVLHKGTSNILLSPGVAADDFFTGGGQDYNKITFGGRATGVKFTTILGSNSFGDTIFSPRAQVKIEASSTQTFNGTNTAIGDASHIITVKSTTNTNCNISSASNFNWSYTNLTHLTGTGGGTFIATNSTDGGGNVNWAIS